ncbi:MAG TPA: SDR family oxidoreductase [Candidatus Acidoferrales bacterium]|nr:SDR family oxidoreductase [Terriglobia bacterium]
MARELAGQNAIVTGASRGFGKAIAFGLAAAGATVTVTARTKSQLEETASQIEALGGRALAVVGDVAKRCDVARVTAAAEAEFGPVTVLVNNAGVSGPYGPVWTLDPDEWWDAQGVVVRGTLLYLNAVMPGMISRKEGCVINVTSCGGQWFTPHLSCYGVSKAGQIRLAEHAAAEAKEHGVSVFIIDPGTVITDMAEATIASLDAQRWVPKMVEYLSLVKQKGNVAEGLARCAANCVRLASGRYAELAGRFLLSHDDFDEMLLEPAPRPGTAIIPRERPKKVAAATAAAR